MIKFAFKINLAKVKKMEYMGKKVMSIVAANGLSEKKSDNYCFFLFYETDSGRKCVYTL